MGPDLIRVPSIVEADFFGGKSTKTGEGHLLLLSPRLISTGFNKSVIERS
jgi:hypothetical protein